MDPVFLSRLQFGLTIGFHYIFPPLTIGMGVVLVWLEGQHLRTGEPLYEVAARFWTKVFALNFALGVATGIVMEFQFGTNWAAYSRFVGDVFGSALAAEGIFAFFLESGFLAVLVFGWDRVGPRMHFFSTLMVALGSIFSSIWIVVANSWQQTPAGHHVVQMMWDGEPLTRNGLPALRAEIVDFWTLVFNPSTLHRLVHVWIGAFLVGSFFIMSISAWYLLKGKHRDFAIQSFDGALILATVSALAMLVSGHLQAENVYEHQPAKIAAFEGHYRTGPGDLHLFGIPDGDTESVRFGLAVPGGLSLLLHGDFSTSVVGLDRFGPDDRPPVFLTFQAYHLMVALGFFFIAVTLLASFLRWRGRLYETRWLLKLFVIAVVLPIVSNEVGWFGAEVGRQPWIVHPPVQWTADGSDVLVGEDGVVDYDEREGLRTSEAVSPNLRSSQVLGSLIGFGAIYLALFAVWLFVLDRKIKHGPDAVAPTSGEHHSDLRGAVGGRALHQSRLTGDDKSETDTD
jgi:cytochrome d ubiquinol oxidase subunit I